MAIMVSLLTAVALVIERPVTLSGAFITPSVKRAQLPHVSPAPLCVSAFIVRLLYFRSRLHRKHDILSHATMQLEDRIATMTIESNNPLTSLKGSAKLGS